MPEPSAVGEGVCHEHLDAVVERDACREQEEEQGLPFGEPYFALHFLAGHIEGQQQHEHRKGEMVGHTDRDHHVGKAEEHRRKQQTVGSVPIGHNFIAQWVESRDMKGADEHLVIVGCELREAV